MRERLAIAVVALLHAGIALAPALEVTLGRRALLLLPLVLAAAPAVARRLPGALDGALRRRPKTAAAWALLALLSLFQTGRLAAFMGDPNRTWGSAFPDPVATDHACMSAYVHAAELLHQGVDNLYAPEHWPAFAGDRPGGESTVAHLGRYLQDPYEYPPTFALLPAFALRLTNDFLVLRGVWFSLQLLAFLAIAVALARFAGGAPGLVMGLLLPAVLASLPTLLDLQFGQVHLIAIAAGVAAMVAFARGRRWAGGLLLGAATVSKIFPGLLVLYLLARRRYRDAGAAVGCGVAFGLLGLLVFGLDVHRDFLTFHLPRLFDGSAFSFFERDDFFVSRNESIYGIVIKLAHLGIPGMTHGLARGLASLYTVVLLGLTVLLARREPAAGDRLAEPLVWLALLNLAALRSPLAPSAYVPASGLWLLTLLAAKPLGAGAAKAARVALLVLAWLLLSGAPPLPTPSPEIEFGLLAQAALIAVNLWALRAASLRRSRTEPAATA